jgi:hypothetical protein
MSLERFVGYFNVMFKSFYEWNKWSNQNWSEELVSRLRSAAPDNNVCVNPSIRDLGVLDPIYN